MNGPRKLWVGSVVIETRPAGFPRLVKFWCAALGYLAREPLGDWALLQDPEKSGPNIAIQQAPKGDDVPGPAGRFHLDLYSSDWRGEVERLVQLGASVVEPEQEGRDFVTLADPEGNIFDVIEASHYQFGQRGD
jgi:hypothetical protein